MKWRIFFSWLKRNKRTKDIVDKEIMIGYYENVAFSSTDPPVLVGNNENIYGDSMPNGCCLLFLLFFRIRED